MSVKPEPAIDKRIAARSLKHERISRKDYEQYLKSLMDVSSKAVPIFSGQTERDEERAKGPRR